MVTSVEKSAKTVKEAIDMALLELSTVLDNVDVEVLEEGNKGLFGIIGGKMAKVKVSIKSLSDSSTKEENKVNTSVKEFLSDIIHKLNVTAEVKIEENNSEIIVEIHGENVGILIGRRGETLDALQYLAGLVANRSFDTHKKLIIDIENYRQRREEALTKLAIKLANRVVKYKKNITLEPMTAYERRIIHAALQVNKFVDTYSVGEEPYRKIVIKLK